ncbi:Small auxin-up RNA [Dillenia turbinata]|uniref:Small auxin-up RNA n=1 Tax=Dillenia turbinata TaxID=194707 RepID=A0AAN8UMS0_9MAGN
MGLRASKLSRMVVGVGGFKRLEEVGSSHLMTPRGYVPICVGVNDDIKYFMVHTKELCHADFMQFLCKSAEEYGFRNQGILRIPSDTKEFEDWMTKRSAKKKMLLRSSN